MSGRRKITGDLERVVLREKKKAPYLGVRALSGLLKEKHKISLSKSAIHKILKSKGISEEKGRKKSILAYRVKGVEDCGLILLRCIDEQIGLFDYLSKELKVYFPKIDKELLKKLIIMASFSSILRNRVKASAEKRGFLRLAGIGHLPARKIEYFSERISKHRPIVSLKSIKENVKLVSTVKFYFYNGYCGFCDAKLSTFWDSLCGIEHFFYPLFAVERRIEQMLENKTIIVGYTKSFDYLSPLTINFLKGINSGVKRVEFLDEKGEILAKKTIGLKMHLLLGYCPKIVSRGMTFLGKPKRFKRFAWEEMNELFCLNISTIFLQPNAKQRLMLNNVLIKRKESSLPEWGILVNFNISKKTKLEKILKQYLYLWPYMAQDFFKDMEIIEKSLFAPKKKEKDYLGKMLPGKLKFEKVTDFVRVSQILSVIFKETIAGWEPKGKSGNFSVGKDYLKISLKRMPGEVKNSFNKACLYINNKRAFLL